MATGRFPSRTRLPDLEKARSHGDKALSGRPDDLDVLVSQTNTAQPMQSNGQIVDYATRGGKAYNRALQQPKPLEVSAEQYASCLADAKSSNLSSYEFLETSGFNAVVEGR
jgi:hypothetical protein